MPRAKANKDAAQKAAAKKPRAPKSHQLPVKFPNGEVLRDLCKKNWRIGDVIGQGGFGLIYLASDQDSANVGKDAEYVVKIEPIANGPLFCELHFYQRVAKPNLIDDWIKSRKMKYLGVPKYISSGSHMHKGSNYRFMVMERFSTDLQKVFEESGKLFSRQSVYAIALRLIDALEYLHENGYVHADVKASNILLGYKKGKLDPDTIHLVDFGLACKYAPGDDHKEYKEDPRKAHDGTVEFTSIDAHKGVGPARRADMEILGYCLLQWLCGRLPWEDKLIDKNYVRDSKIKYMNDIPALMKKCFPAGDVPDEIPAYLAMVKKLKYDEKPNYNKMRDIFVRGLSNLGVKDTWKLALPIGGAVKTASPKKAVKRHMNGEDFEEPKSKMKAKVASPRPSTPKTASRPGTPKTGGMKTKPATPLSLATSPSKAQKTKPSAATAAAQKRLATVKGNMAAGRGRSPGPAKARAVGAKAIAETLSPSPGPSRHKATPKRVTSPDATSPAPKKRKVVRKKVEMAEISVQTSPGLKKNR